MIKKWVSLIIIGVMVLAPASAYAKGFSGGSYSKGSSYSRSYSGGSSSIHSGSSSSGTYHSGYRSPSSNVGRSNSLNNNGYNYSNNSNRTTGGFWSHAAAFGAGTFIGSMLHPFGGGYGYGMGGFHSFSLIGLLVDLIILWIVFKVIGRLFFRRY
ncbi:hypothetical protein [Aneurinibacillus terranovensis]|uniref:hypothetical protein n=1 Tax=Aneurinibacillus terranovensis TaxID=278991 RepID=UPI000425A42B|nr:hypothetical protein [Aneurinibacillus terranovensis]